MPKVVSKHTPTTLVDPNDPEQLGASVTTDEPAVDEAGVVTRPVVGWEDRPIRTDPTGTTVQPVDVVSGGGINSSVGSTGSPVPASATFTGAKNPGGNLEGLNQDADGNLLVNDPVGGAPNMAAGQIAIDDVGEQVVAVRATRRSVIITQLGSSDLYIGVTGVTASTGQLLPGVRGASLSIPTTLAVFAIADTGNTSSVSFMEVWD